MSKQKLVARMKRTRLSLNDKIKILKYASENPKKGCRDIANQFQIGKTAAATILRDGKKLRKEYEFFKGDCKTKRTGQFMVTNEILYKWYGKCCAAGIYPFGSMLQEEALKIKESLNASSLDIKIVFLPKNTTSRLQPLDAGIIRAFKLKYRKLLIKYVISRVDENMRAPDIIKAVDILKVIGWVKSAWEEVTPDTIKHCFEKCGFPTEDYAAVSLDFDEEFQTLFNEISADCSVDEYLDADNSTATCEEVDANKVDWRETLRQECIDEVVNGKEETIDSDLDDEDDANESSSSDATVTVKEALYLLDKVQLFAAYNDEQGSLQKAVADIISMVEDFSIHSKKQSSITDFFKKK